MATGHRPRTPTAWWRWPGTRSPGSWAASASTPRSTSRKGKVAECHSTSSIFRGYSIFMKGKDPRDAHFITSRICGICGDNHATCSCYAQNMAYGVKPPAPRRVDRQPGRGGRVHVRPQHLPGEPGRGGLLREDGGRDQSRRARAGQPDRVPPRRRARLQDHRRHHAVAQPVLGRLLPRSAADEPHDPGDVLPDGGPPRPSLHPLSRRGRDHRHHPAVHRLPEPAHALRRVHEAGRAAARRPVRLLLPGPARLRGGRPPAGAARLLGQLPGSRRCATSTTAT